MKVLEGKLPEGTAWRVLLTLAPGQALGRLWRLAQLLASGNDGDLIAAAVVEEGNQEQIATARQMFERAAEQGDRKNYIYPVIVSEEGFEQELNRWVKSLDIDLVLDDVHDVQRYSLDRVTSAVGIVRGDVPEAGQETAENTEVRRILVPTAGGPNTVHTLQTLLPLAPEVEITALYVAPEYLGSNEEALGRSRLKQVLQYIDANGRIKTKLTSATSVAEGIRQELESGYDMIIIGASRESSLDRALFGNLPDTIVRESKRPVLIMRLPKDVVGHVLQNAIWRLQNLIPRLNIQARTEAYVRVRRSARPDIDFFILIALSAAIAALGLIIDSAAVVIGAMLVAPLMSPIVGIGMAIVLGDPRFLRLALAAVVRGAILVVIVGALAGLLHLGQPLTEELLGRTAPSLADLGIALFSGMAAAYAISHSAAAAALPGVAIAAALVPPLATIGVAFSTGHFAESLGATLLFVTNLVAMSSATALTFLLLGFRPTPSQKARREVRARSGRIAFFSLVGVAAALVAASYFLGLELRREARIREVVEEQVALVTGAILVEAEIVSFEQGHLTLDVVVRSPRPIPFSEVEAVQEQIGTQLASEGIIEDIAMTLSVIRFTQLDPLQPPTATPTPTVTSTSTPGPTPTFTPTATPTPLPTATATSAPATATATVVPTATETPLPSITPSPTPVTASVNFQYGLNLRAEPGTAAEVLAVVPDQAAVTMMEGEAESEGGTWQLVAYNGQVGWVLQEYLRLSP